jgi:curved DNA-binding protein CbpA
MLPNYYAILGTPPTATLDELRRAYRKAAFAAHPDRGGSHRLMQRINEAWEILGNDINRRAYDLQRASQPTPASPTSAEPASAKSSRKPAPKTRPGAKCPPGPRPPTFARIAGSLFGRALNTLNHWISPAPPKKPRAPGPRVTVVPCRYCGQKLRVKPGAAKIRCPKCRHWDVLS